MSHVTNAMQLAPPIPRKIVPVGEVPGLNKVDGSPAELSARQLTAYEYGEHIASCRDEWGQQTAKSISHENLKFLGQVLCDAQGNRLWHDEESVIKQLGQYPKPIIDHLIIAASKANTADAAAVDRAEKNSGTTQDSSETGTTPSTSDASPPES